MSRLSSTASLIIGLLFSMFAAAQPVAPVIEPRLVPGAFPTNGDPAQGGGIYPVLSGPGVANGNEATGAVTFDLRRHSLSSIRSMARRSARGSRSKTAIRSPGTQRPLGMAAMSYR